MTAEEISPVIAAHVLYCYDSHGGYKPGRFVESLIFLIQAADPINRRKLALGFPGYVAACEVIETPGGGVETVQAIAGAVSAPQKAAEPVLDPDCRDGKCGSCIGDPCEHECHQTAGAQ